MKANRKFVEDYKAVSAVIGVILMVAITVAIAATVYVYTSGIGSTPKELESASIASGKGTKDQIKLILTHGGKDYHGGYNITDEVNIYIDGEKVTIFDTETWITGGQILLGKNGADDWEEGETVAEGHYDVTVSVRGNVVFDGKIKVG